MIQKQTWKDEIRILITDEENLGSVQISIPLYVSDIFSKADALIYALFVDDIQKDLDDTDSITFSRWVSRKSVIMCANRLEYILANNPDNFDLDVELSNLYETLRFVEKNLKVAGGINE